MISPPSTRAPTCTGLGRRSLLRICAHDKILWLWRRRELDGEGPRDCKYRAKQKLKNETNLPIDNIIVS